MRHPSRKRRCKKHCRCSKTLIREIKELRLQLKEFRDKYYGRKRKKKKEILQFQKEPKKKGAPPGHPGWYREKPDVIDEVETLIPQSCDRCGSPELKPSKIDDEVHIQEDIILPKRIVKKFVRKVFKCTRCHSLVRGGQGRDEMPHSYIGPKAKAWANHLRYEIGIPQHKIKMIFKQLFDMPFVQASVAGFENQLRRRSQDIYGQIKNEIVHTPSRYADETGWKESGQSRQLWCFCNPQVAFFHINQSRGSKVIKDILGESFQGILISDFYSAYNKIQGQKQKCIPHLLRIIHRKELLFGSETKETGRFLEEMKLLSLRIMELFRKRKSIRDYLTHRADVVAMLRRRLSRPLDHKPLDKWRKKIKEHAKELTTCLFHPNSDSNNNFVERMLRSSVIMRKITFGNRSWNGIQNHQVIMSLLQTIKLNHQVPADIFYRILIKPSNITLDEIITDPSDLKNRAPPRTR